MSRTHHTETYHSSKVAVYKCSPYAAKLNALRWAYLGLTKLHWPTPICGTKTTCVQLSSNTNIVHTCGDGTTVEFWLPCGGQRSTEVLNGWPLWSSVELTMTTMATLMQPRDAKAQKTPKNPSTATEYRSGTRQDSGKKKNTEKFSKRCKHYLTQDAIICQDIFKDSQWFFLQEIKANFKALNQYKIHIIIKVVSLVTNRKRFSNQMRLPSTFNLLRSDIWLAPAKFQSFWGLLLITNKLRNYECFKI